MNRHQQRFIEGLRLAAHLPEHRSEVVLPAYARRIDFLLPSIDNPLDLQVLCDIGSSRPLAIEHVSSAGSVVDAASAEMAQRWLYLQWRRYRTRRGRATMQADDTLFAQPRPPNAVVIAQRLVWTAIVAAYPTHWLSHDDSVIWLPGPENSGVALIDSARLPSDIGGDVLRWLTATDPVLHQRYLEAIMDNPNISDETKLRINKGVLKREEVFTAGERECVAERLRRESREEGIRIGRAEGAREHQAEMRTALLSALDAAGRLPSEEDTARMSNEALLALITARLRDTGE